MGTSMRYLDLLAGIFLLVIGAGVKPQSLKTVSNVPLSKQETKNNSNASFKFSIARTSVFPCKW